MEHRVSSISPGRGSQQPTRNLAYLSMGGATLQDSHQQTLHFPILFAGSVVRWPVPANEMRETMFPQDACLFLVFPSPKGQWT